MTPEFTVDEVVPHAGTMSLLERIVEHNEESLTAEVTIGPDTLFVEEQGVPSWIGIEYMAQAIAAFAGVQRRQIGKEAQVGFLVGTRRYDCNCSYFPRGSVLRITVEREFQADNGLGAFNCAIRSDDIVAESCLNVFLPDNVEEFLGTQYESSNKGEDH